MSTDYKLKACSDYCPLENGEEDMCIGMAQECYSKGSSNEIKDSPQNKVLEMARKIRMIQAAKEAKPVAVIGD